METAKTPSIQLVTPRFKVSYPNVFQPRLNNLNQKMEYSVEALFPKGTDLKPLQQAVLKAIVDRWGPTAKPVKDENGDWALAVEGKTLTNTKNGKTTPAPFRIPFKDQGDKEKDGVLPAPLEKGAMFISLKSTNKPGVVDQNVQPILDSTDFYAGCMAIAQVNVKAYDQAGNRGVSVYLNHLQKVAEGEPLGGRSRPEDAFKAIAGASTDGENDSADKLF